MKQTIVLAALLLTSASSLQAGLELNLQAHYTFDDQDGRDYSGNSLELDLVGGISFEPGLIGYALAPNGDNSKYATRPGNDASLNFGPGDFTIQAWVNFNSLTGEQVLLEKFSGNSGPGWTLVKLASNKLVFSTDIGGVPLVVSEVQEIPLDTWHQVVIRKTTGLYELFLNNAVIASINAAASSSTTVPLLIGRRNEVDGRDFSLEGSIDEIMIWSRSLNGQELATLYNGGEGQTIPPIFSDGFEFPE